MLGPSPAQGRSSTLPKGQHGAGRETEGFVGAHARCRGAAWRSQGRREAAKDSGRGRLASLGTPTCHVVRYSLALRCTCMRILSRSRGATAVLDLQGLGLWVEGLGFAQGGDGCVVGVRNLEGRSA